MSLSASLPMRLPSFAFATVVTLSTISGRLVEPVRRARLDDGSEQRGVGRIAREGANRDGVGRVEAIVLHESRPDAVSRRGFPE
jgi:hypothetical protein